MTRDLLYARLIIPKLSEGIFYLPNQLTRKLIYKNQTIGFFARKLLQIPYLKAIAVIFVVLAVLFITTAIAGSFSNFSEGGDEDDTIVKDSFIYASDYLNSAGEIVEQTFYSGDFVGESNIMIDDSAFVANNSPSAMPLALAVERSGIITYEVQTGDAPSEIASAFGITTNTLLWANNLSPLSKIKTGQKLIILPVSGVKHTIQKGETLESIVRKYKGDVSRTIALNGLPANGNLIVGQDIIIPDGQKPVQYVPATSYASYTPEELGPYGEISHKFPWGQCTWYVAQKRYVPWSGHAKDWLRNAAAFGFETGKGAKVGAIVVTREHNLYGHVAYVESMTDNTITVSEMSLGRGIKIIRTLQKDNWKIVGYIY